MAVSQSILMKILFCALVLLGAPMIYSETPQSENYQVIGKQGKDGAYSGNATLTRTKGAFKLDWNITAPKSNLSQGFGLIHHQRMAVVFGKQSTSLIILSLHEKGLIGKSVQKDDLDTVTDVRLELIEGTPYDGVFRFVEGGIGEIQVQPFKENPLELFVTIVGPNLQKLEGLGLWTGDVLQIAPALASGELGLMSFTLGRDDAFHGVWTNGDGVNMETLKPASNKKPTPDPRGLPFDKQAYYLSYNQSRPGEGVSEEREYLRMGETSENFSKKIIIRRYNTHQLGASELNQTLLLSASESEGLVSSQILEDKERIAGHTLIFKKSNKDRIFHLVFIHRDENYLTSTHLVVANRFDLTEEDRFAEHIQKNLKDWANEIRKLATVTPAFLRVTSTMPVIDTSKAPEATPQTPEKK